MVKFPVARRLPFHATNITEQSDQVLYEILTIYFKLFRLRLNMLLEKGALAYYLVLWMELRKNLSKINSTTAERAKRAKNFRILLENQAHTSGSESSGPLITFGTTYFIVHSTH